MEDLVVGLVVYGAAAALLVKHHDVIRDAINAFINNFPGGRGPRPPMHPSPANDDALLRRRKPTLPWL